MKLSSKRSKRNRVKKAYGSWLSSKPAIYTLWEGTIYTLWESQKEKREGQKVYLKKYWLKISQNWREKWASRFLRGMTPNRLYLKRATLKHVIISLKSKTKNLESSKGEGGLP